MVRKSSEAEDDSAAKAVRTKAPPRDEDADDEGSSPTTKNTPANESKTEQEDKKLKAAAKGRLTQAPGSFQEEMNGGSKVASAKAKGGADPKKADTDNKTPNIGMFAAVHQEQNQNQNHQNQHRRSNHRRRTEDDSSSSSSITGQVGAFAQGGNINMEATDTVTPPEQSSPHNHLNEAGMLPIAAVAVEERSAPPPPPQPPMVQAEPAEPKQEEEQQEEAIPETKWLLKPRNRLILIAFILLVVGSVVAVVLLVLGSDNGDGPQSNDLGNSSSRQVDDGSEATTPTPSTSPSVSLAPTSTYDRLYGLISAYSGEAVLEDSMSPQSQAFQWTLGDFDAGGWPDDTILERYALATLFYSTNGGRWLTVTDFLLQRTYCDWQGVECSNDVITSLSLPSENVDGTLPREIGLLTSLISLDLSNNDLSGSLPSEIGLLTSLEVMDLSLTLDDLDTTDRSLRGRKLEDTIPSSALTGSIPSEVGLLRSLVNLDLSGNDMSGNLPSEIGELDNIQKLSLHDNALEGAIPLQLGFLSTLQQLSLQKNQLTGDVPNSLCSSFSLIQDLSSDCLADSDGGKPAEVVCKCCNVCCDANNVCRDLDVTAFPSSSPSTSFPSASPTIAPTSAPSTLPSTTPSALPSAEPSFNPTPPGTPEPTVTASQSPSQSPTSLPSTSPSFQPTTGPTIASSMFPTDSCRINENSCLGNRACNGATELCTESGSCSGRNACRGATDMSVGQDSCIGTSACQQATGIISSSSCTEDSSCTGFGGISIGPNSCNCPECCSCYGTGELSDVIPSNSCNVRGECCSTPSPTVSPTKNPTQRPTTSAPTTPQPTPNPTPQPTPSPTSAFDAAFAEMMDFAETKSSQSSLRDTNSPQYKAVEWLAQDKVDNGSSWSGYELTQRYVLRVLYHSTNGDNWSNSAPSKWFGASSVCNWGSVDARCNGQQVDHISLFYHNLQGTIPDELGQLTALTELDLSENQLTSTIPTQLGQLTALASLHLQNNQLSGSIPLALTQLTNLGLAILGRLYLYGNNLTGAVPSEFCAAPFPDWRGSGSHSLWADCMSEVQCECCDICFDESGNCFRWNGSGFESC